MHSMRPWLFIAVTLFCTTRLPAWVTEDGTLRDFVLGSAPGCAYDNWASHVSEGIADSGYNDYGPDWFDPQTNGFGSYFVIPNNASGDSTFDLWRAVYSAAINEQWPMVDSIVSAQDSLWNYELVELNDTELNKTFYLLRERLDSSYVDDNVDSISTDDVIGSFRNGWGLFVFNPTAGFPKLNIEMPHPEDDFLAVPIGLDLFIRTDARAMMIAGASREVAWDTTHASYNNNYSLSDPTRNCRSPFALMHEVLYDLLDAGPTSPLVSIQQHSYDYLRHPTLNDIQLSAFADDSRPNPPLRDRAAHLDIIHFMGEFPINGLPGHPEITARIDQYVGLWSNPAYSFYGAADTIPIPAVNNSLGAPQNCEGVYSHQNHNQYVDPENFIHVEIDEYPDRIWSPPQWQTWLPGNMPATWETYQLALAYYNPYVAAMDSALRFTYLYPDTTPPATVQLAQVVPFTADSIYLRWSPQAVDRFFDTYTIYYDTTEITDSSRFINRQTTGFSSLREFSTTSVVMRVPVPPTLDRYLFAVGSRDIWGNIAARSLSSGVTPGPYLLVSGQQVSDSAGGNDNGMVEFGEQLGITVIENNVGSLDAIGVMVRLSTDDLNLLFTDSTEYYGLIPAQSQHSISNAFRATVSPSVADSHVIPVSITTTDTLANVWNYGFNIMAHASKPLFLEVIVNDSAGNANGLFDPGETVVLSVILKNSGSAQMDSLVVTLTSDYADLTIPQPVVTLSALAPGQTATLSGFILTAAPTAPPTDRACFYLALAMTRNRTDHLLFELPIGGFSDPIENGEGAWTHLPNQQGWNDQWHISTEMSHSPTHSWKCGSTGTGNYMNHLDAVLLTPTITLTGHEELRFWHYIQAESSPTYPDSAYDGGIVEISANGGPWEQLTPAAGYNKHVRCTTGGGNPYTGPFTCRIPIFSGTISWREVVCDLGAYSGDVQIRFHFGSDNVTTREGWYVDNVRVVRANNGTAPQNLQALLTGATAHLSWRSPPTGVLTGDLQGYNVYRDSTRISSLVQALTYDDNLSRLPSGDYAYNVTAQYSDSESVFSNPATVTWDSLLIPVSDLTIVLQGQELILNWTPVNASFYFVLSSDDPTDFTNADWTSVTTPPFIITDFSQFTRRFYLIIAARQ